MKFVPGELAIVVFIELQERLRRVFDLYGASTATCAIILDPLIRKVLARESAELETEVRVPDGLAMTTDTTLLGRALGNLFRNAAIHADPHAHVEIEAIESPEAISISVTDNGPGVPSDELPRIFEPFHRLDRARSRRPPHRPPPPESARLVGFHMRDKTDILPE